MAKNKNNNLVDQGFITATAITKNYAKSFYFASRFLSREKRLAAFSVYAICRISDDSVDIGEKNRESKLEKIKAQIQSVYSNAALSNDLLSAFKQTVDKYKIPQGYFIQLLEGIKSDLYKNRYENFKQLHEYCYKVAGVVGLIILKIFGQRDPLAEKYAVDLGIAMQLTNILRDIKEDFQRKRIYLPQDEMNRFRVSESDIAEGRLENNFKELLKFQIRRARQYYRDCEPGIKMIGNLRARFVVSVMKEIYAGILVSIEQNNYRVFSKRAHVKNIKKIFTIFKILIGGKYL